MKKFVLAALPFVALGICVIIIVINSKNKKVDDTYLAEGMCLGMSFGLLFGSMFSDHLGIFLSLGMMIGEAIGSFINKKGK